MDGVTAAQVVSNLGSVAASAFAALSCRQRARSVAGPARRAWLLLASGALSWCLGQVLWSWNEFVRGADVPFLSLSDVGYLAMVPFAVMGMATLVPVGRRAVHTALDGILITGSLFYVSWAFVLAPLYHTAGHSILQRITALAYPFGDLAMAGMALIMLGQAHRRHRLTLSVLATGLLCLAVADSGFAYLVQHNLYHTGDITDAGWIVGFALIAVAARIPWPAVSRDAGETAKYEGLWLALPCLPLGVAMIVAAFLRLTGQPVGMMLFFIEMALVMLVVLRLVVGLRDNQRLTVQLRSAVVQLRHLAYHDALTGLANRVQLDERAQLAVAESDRTGTGLAVLYIDLDGFKAVNDAHGHDAGDELLIAAADRLRACARPGDVLARLGGDEFVVLLAGLDDPAEAVTAADRIGSALAEPFTLRARTGPVTARVAGSIGLASRATGGPGFEELLTTADHDMYRQKRRSKERAVQLAERT